MGVGSRTQQGPASPRSAAPPLSPSPPAPGAEPPLCQPDTAPRACLQGVSARGRGKQDDVCILSPRARAVRTAEEGAPGSSRAGGRGGRRAGGGAATRRGCDLGPSKGAESAGVRGWAAGSQRLNTHGRAERGDGGEGRLRWFWPGQKWLVGTWCRLDTCPEPRSAPPHPAPAGVPSPLTSPVKFLHLLQASHKWCRLLEAFRIPPMKFLAPSSVLSPPMSERHRALSVPAGLCSYSTPPTVDSGTLGLLTDSTQAFRAKLETP